MYFDCFKEVPGQMYRVFHIHTITASRQSAGFLFLKDALETQCSLIDAVRMLEGMEVLERSLALSKQCLQPLLMTSKGSVLQ